jgi:group I intron endonuclease
MTFGIYSIRNTVNGKQYIGSAVNMAHRWKLHVCKLLGARHHSSLLQNAWNKYGADAFEIRVLLQCVRANLLFYEQICIDGLASEYKRMPDCR